VEIRRAQQPRIERRSLGFTADEKDSVLCERALVIPPILSSNSLGLEEVTSLLFGAASLPKQKCDAQLTRFRAA